MKGGVVGKMHCLQGY